MPRFRIFQNVEHGERFYNLLFSPVFETLVLVAFHVLEYVMLRAPERGFEQVETSTNQQSNVFMLSYSFHPRGENPRIDLTLRLVESKYLDTHILGIGITLLDTVTLILAEYEKNPKDIVLTGETLGEIVLALVTRVRELGYSISSEEVRRVIKRVVREKTRIDLYII